MSNARYRLRPAAARQLRQHARYLHDEAGPDVAHRFVEGAYASFGLLSDSPGIGAPVQNNNPRLSGLRKWRVEGFPHLLIFYFPESRGIRIIQLLHAAMDWQSLLDAD